MAELQPALSPEAECDLIERCQSGDRAAFEALFQLYRDDVFRFSFLVARDASVAQDVVQETFLKVFRSIGKFQFRSSFKSWLYRIAVNESITMFRRRKVKEDLAPFPDAAQPHNSPGAGHEWQPEEAVLEGEERQLLRRAIGQLDPVHRTVVVLKYFHEFSDTEIALMIGCPPGTVKSRLHRARELLRHSMVRQMGRPDLMALSYARLTSNPV
ncbi:MAG TPA: sigma-70 family RNA polymerase sigma factor [Symbiobacteriaceae bacterium]|jgi:RNA polymerase sigma-70 factor (ECF subfamily)